MVISLHANSQMDDATCVVGLSYIDDVMKHAAAFIRGMVTDDHRIYRVGHSQLAFLATAGSTVHDFSKALLKKKMIFNRHMLDRFMIMPKFAFAALETAGGAYAALRQAMMAALNAENSQGMESASSPDLEARYHRAHQLLVDFPIALQGTDQLRLVFQPRMDLETRRIIGAETLLR